jgi:signal transduction histidine kinase
MTSADRRAKVLAWGSLAFVVACTLASIVFTAMAWGTPAPPNVFGPKGFSATLGLVFATVGAILASRVRTNPIGWIFCACGVLGGIQAVGSSYALWALLDQGGGPPGGTWGAWLEEWSWIPIVGSLAVVAAIFPDGRFLSARWRLACIVFGTGTVVASLMNAVVPELAVYDGYPNPVGVGWGTVGELAPMFLALLAGLLVVGTASAFVRFRRSHDVERQQLKWLVVSVGSIALMGGIYAAVGISQGPELSAVNLDWAENLMILSILGVPVAIGIGVLKYRLYDIDVVINRAVVYGALAAFIALVYVAIVAGVGGALGSRGDTWLSAVAAAVVALAFQPVRRRAQHLANRFAYGERATPYEVLSELSTRFADTYSLDEALPRLARVTAEAVGADRARIWLRSGEELRPAAAWPTGGSERALLVAGDRLPASANGETAFAVRQRGELLGAITVEMPANETLVPAQTKLLTDVAAQAGLVLRNVALLEDLRASRKRIVSAQDERARALERNIHDGAQQQLVALTVKLRLAQGLLEDDPGKAGSMLEELQGQAQTALEDLRDLARGIYPPLLADKGLTEALTAQGRKGAVPVRVVGADVGRFPQDIEAAVYFCSLEALQNAAKYAGASSVAIRLSRRDGILGFEVEDDGVGFDPATTPRGSGLQNMADRLAAIGGALSIRSAPGSGTTIGGSIPV